MGRHAAAPHRPCPACGNAQTARTRVIYRIPAFDVLECIQCSASFVNLPIKSDSGFPAEYSFSNDTTLTAKAKDDVQALKAIVKGLPVGAVDGVRLLDVGCGIGTFLLWAQREGWRVAGLEMNPGAAAFARAERGLDVTCGSAEQETAYSPASFEVVTLWGVIEHMASPAAAAKECARVLVTGGLLILQTPAGDGILRKIGLFLYRATGGLMRFQVKEFYQTDGGHSVIFGRRSMRFMLGRCGFEIVSIRPSTYGLRILLKRFKNSNLPTRIVKSAGTAALFMLGRALRAENHMTVVARKIATPN